MVSATRWRQDLHSAPDNPNQRIRFGVTYPSGGGGYSAFGWSPMSSFDGMFKMTGSPAGYTSTPGLSGVGAPLIPSFSGIAKVAGALAGVLGGLWLARANLGG